MDDCYARYGFLTTYERTWFVKRIEDNKFALSPPVSHKTQSSATDVSLRECFLATALRAANAEDSRYTKKSGSHLVCYGTS